MNSKFKNKCEGNFKVFVVDIFLFICIQHRKESNVNIIDFCQLKNTAIDHKCAITEEAKEMYQLFLSENLAREKKLREQK